MARMIDGATKRTITIIGFIFIIAGIYFTAFRSSDSQPGPFTAIRESSVRPDLPGVPPSEFSRVNPMLTGPAIAPKLGNETVKAELGRAAWKLFHTTMARFPDTPTTDESEALRSYIHLFQRLYPCGECAQHFGQILEKYPPQVSSRSAAAGWACHVHNEVSRSLEKAVFDCSKIGDFYDCGCADDEKEQMNAAAAPGPLHARRSIGEDGKRANELDMMPRERRRHVDSRTTEI